MLDTGPEPAFDDLTRLASMICDAPIALVSLVDTDRQWFKARVGIDAVETPRRVAFCAHAINQPQDVLVVSDSFADARFADNPLVTGAPHVRFYAGAPLVAPGGLPLGTLCVIDHKPRQLTSFQLETLKILGRQVISELELRRQCASLQSLTDQLQRAYRELEDFSFIAAHDLQEPLRKLRTFSALLREDLGSELPEQAGRDLFYIEDAATRMRRLIDDLLQLSRAGTAKLELQAVAVGECVQHALDALSERVASSQAKVACDDLPELRIDRTLITQLFQNLIGNALKFVRGRAPDIRVTCAREGGQVVLGVRDNGIGIDPEHCERVFAPFKRLHSRGEFEGTGIGLSIVRKAVERHGGRIWIESSPGQGSHFRFTLGAGDTAAVAEPACTA